MNLLFNKIILHHSKTKDSETVSWDAIRDYHIKTNGWKDVGYAFCVEQVGLKSQVMIGRPLTEYGSHCLGQNIGSVGICVVGDYDTEKLPLEKELLLIDLCVFLCVTLGINPKEIYGDRDFHPTKTCPGNIFPLRRIKENVIRVFTSYEGIRLLLSNELKLER